MRIRGNGTKGRLEGCDISGNEETGLVIDEGADPVVKACKCAGGERGGGVRGGTPFSLAAFHFDKR